MKLEVLRVKAQKAPQPFAVLFVHGICCGAKVWRPRFMQAFAKAGYDAYAVSLRGHGGSDGRTALAWTTLSDYAHDLEQTVAAIDKPTVIVGHSMGGAVLQEFMRRGGRPAAAVLMNSVPPYGLASASLRLLLNAPGAWGSLAMANAFGLGVFDISGVRDILAGPRVPKRDFDAFMNDVGPESPLVGFELQGWRPFAPAANQADLPPVLTIGGEYDGLVSVADLHATAEHYGVEAVVLDGMGHVPMIEPDWRRAAEPVLDWIDGVAALRAAA